MARGNPRIRSSPERWPELYRVAEQIADITCLAINRLANVPTQEACAYKAQSVLERVIAILQKRV